MRTPVLAGAVTLLLAAPAPAAQVALHGGVTTFKLDTRAGLVARPLAPAVSGRRGIALPITRGRVNPRTLGGKLTHGGGVRLRAGRRSLTLRRLRSHITLESTLSSRGRVLFGIDLRKSKVERIGVASRGTGFVVRLTRPGARVVNRALNTKLRPGRRIGTLTIRTEPAEMVVLTGNTEIAFSESWTSLLTSNAINYFSADGGFLPQPGLVRFPVRAGRADLESFAGAFTHVGTLGLFRDYATVRLTDWRLDTVTGGLSTRTDAAGEAFTLMQLDLDDLERTLTAKRRVVFGNVPARLTSAGAAVLNATLATTIFGPGIEVGTVTLTGRAV